VYAIPGTDLSPTILRTCRQICDEAKPVLYRPEYLYLELSLDGDSRGQDGEVYLFPATHLTQVCILHTLEVYVRTTLTTMEEDLAHSLHFAAKLLDSLKLKQLGFTFDDHWDVDMNRLDSDTLLEQLEALLRV